MRFFICWLIGLVWFDLICNRPHIETNDSQQQKKKLLLKRRYTQIEIKNLKNINDPQKK